MNTKHTAHTIFTQYTRGRAYYSTEAAALEQDNDTPRDVLDAILNGGTWGDVSADTRHAMDVFAACGIDYDARAAMHEAGIGRGDENTSEHDYDDLLDEVKQLMSQRDQTDFLMVSALAHGEDELAFEGTARAYATIDATAVGHLDIDETTSTVRGVITAPLDRLLTAHRNGEVFTVRTTSDQ